MSKIITFNFNENFISRLTDYLEENYLKKNKDLSRIAIVFGGKRPALFLKKELSQRLKSGFFPGRFFSMDEFIKFIVAKNSRIRLCSDLDSSYFIYNVAKLKAPEVLKKREEFAEFLPWAKEISSFIDELDLEDVSKDKLKDIQLSAAIGFEIPESINKLLTQIMSIIEAYHQELRSRLLYSRGLLYQDAANSVKKNDFSEFDQILFCNFYYLHKTEERVMKQLFDAGLATLIFQKDERNWPVLDQLAKTFGQEITPASIAKSSCELKIYKGFDTHSQVGLVRAILKENILKEKASLNKTLVLLPEAENLIPLLSEIAGEVEEFNVSMGYPLKRSSLYNLLQYIFTAQGTKKENGYYTRDYLRVILHPLIKNLKSAIDPALTRVLMHKAEEMFLGMSKTPLSGSLFVKLPDIELSEELYNFSMDTLINMETEAQVLTLKKILLQVHEVSFGIWEGVTTFAKLVFTLKKFASIMLEKSFVSSHPLNLKVLERIYEIIDELKDAEFKEQTFPQEDIFKILESKLKEEKVSFKGSPLKGLQILGLLETRALTFDNVIIMDANENILPKISVYEPLIPRQIMEGLGLERLKQEEEIQRYHFMRLVMGAKSAYFVYDDNPEKERSRFLEEIIWQRQMDAGTLKAVPQSLDGTFRISVYLQQDEPQKKTKAMVDFLTGEFEYSASSVDDYLSCPLKFYYQHILHLREKEDLLDDPEARDIGNFLHEFLDHIYRGFLNKAPVLNQEFQKLFFAKFKEHFREEIEKRMGRESFMVERIMRYRLERFLEHERSRKVKAVLSLEEKSPIGVINLNSREMKFKYRIDRVDELADRTLLVIDYKTGTSAKGPENLKSLKDFSRQEIKRYIHSFQLPIYYYFTRNKYIGKPINAALYNLRDLEMSYFIKPQEIKKAQEAIGVCMKALEVTLAEIADPKVDFYPDKTDERQCQNCPFIALCC
jgi:CRISPR/Cas system-associated exonuclease Cas4 (RecB family)